MCLKAIQSYWQQVTILVFLAALSVTTSLIIHRGLHGEYGFGIHGISIVFLGMFPFIIVFFARRWKTKFSLCASGVVALLLSILLVVYYLSSNGLWCAQHPKVKQEMCEKLLQFASFAASSNVTSWWLTLGDLLAVQRGQSMPMTWEHDIDVCITPEQFPMFEKALASHVGYFHPEAERLGQGHWYLPIDMERMGLRARDAEGVNVDIWTCPRAFTGNITRVDYCHGLMNVPGSWAERHSLLTKEYGDYSVIKYEHHDSLCRIWRG